tara:strand:- start:1420 stop:1590 length:171 start_codon:yes stop_codon:yes gene_type:complete
MMNWEDIIKNEELLKGLDSIKSIIEYLEDASEQKNYSAELLRTIAKKAANALSKLE